MSAPKYVRPLSEAERAEVDRLARRGGDGRLVRRAQIVRLSARGEKCPRIAQLLGVSVPTVHRVIDTFNQDGLEGLPDKPRSGRPRKATRRYIECLTEAVAASPRDLGYPFSSWTVARLREHLARRCRVLLHPDYLARLMAKEGIVYRRPRHVMGHLRDPKEYREKKEFLEFLKKTHSTPPPTSTSSSWTNVKFTCTRP